MNEDSNSQKQTDSVNNMYHDLFAIFTGDEINYQDWYQRLSQKRIFDEVVNHSYDGWMLLHYVASSTELEDTQLCKIAKWLRQWYTQVVCITLQRCLCILCMYVSS